MPRQSTVYEVVIASPSDVVVERRLLIEVVEDWNSAHSIQSKNTLLPRRWELDVTPNAHGRPQESVNRQIIDSADILFAVFQARLGSATGNSLSGTVEEIERFREKGKPVMIYFSTADLPRNHDREQLRRLEHYKSSIQDSTLYSDFLSLDDLRRKASRNLAQKMNDLSPAETRTLLTQMNSDDLTPEARELLTAAAHDPGGQVIFSRTITGDLVMTNQRSFGELGNPRSAAKWKDALERLENHGLVRSMTHSGNVFEVTEAGYRMADYINLTQPMGA